MMWITLFIVMMVYIGQVNAATYYVSTAGNDANNCTTAQTIGTPKRTIQSGIGCLGASDTLLIRAGTYTEGISVSSYHVPSGGGSWATAITIAGYQSENVTISQGITIQDNLDSSVVSYVIFDKLTVRNVNGVTVFFGGNSNHLRISNSDLTMTTNGDIANGNIVQIASTTSFNEVINNNIHDAPVTLFSPSFPGVTTGNYGMYINGHNMLIDGNTVHGNTGYAIHLYHQSITDVHDNIVRNNIIYGNCTDDGTRNESQGAVVIGSGHNNLFYNNILYNNTGSLCRATVQVGYEDGIGNSQVYNNTITGNIGGAGISINPSAPNTHIVNNIIWNNTSDTVEDDGATGTDIHNNLLGVNPLFVNPGAANFALQAGSPAIDTGATITTTTGMGSGVNVTVNDAIMFKSGDSIQVGTVTATVSSVNYTTNVITLTSSISWSSGAGVSFPFHGSAPDKGALESGTVTLVATSLAFGQQPNNAQVTQVISPAVTVRVLDQFGALFNSTATITLAIGSNPGSGTLSGSKVIAAVAGTATFSTLSINNTGNGYTLVATSGSLTSATSNSFNIITSPPPPSPNDMKIMIITTGQWMHH